MLNRVARHKKRRKQEQTDIIRRRAENLFVQYQHCALHMTESGVTKNEKEIVVSLTTFDKRIYDVHLTIETLLQQSHKPDRIVLWVSREDFGENDIPAILKRQMARGLEIGFCEEDLGPYTKFFYALEKYPNSLIVTVDDDIMYPPDMIDQLYKAYLKEPEVIHCHRAHDMTCDTQGQPLPYKQWLRFSGRSEAGLDVFPTGVGGVMYFPGCFDDEIRNKAVFRKLAPNADDVWLKAMSLKKGTLCKKINDTRAWSLRFLTIPGSQVFSLKRKNKQKDTGNDVQIAAVLSHYGLTLNNRD